MLFEMVLETIGYFADWVGHRVIRAWRALTGRRGAPPPSDVRAWWVGVATVVAVFAVLWFGFMALPSGREEPPGGAGIEGAP